jgi:hypothetical protein
MNNPTLLSYKELCAKAIEAMDNFDYEAAALEMKRRNHTWRGATESPCAMHIKKTVHYLIENAIKAKGEGNDAWSCGTGGYFVYMFSYGIKIAYETVSKSSF